ncbi:MAG: rod shape-determining protein MreC [Hyphomonadaceae bacterium]|nr:rod shape-determining protein MreC [Hyphomonadaceae bacterium]
MARRRSVVRRAGAGRKITPGLMLAIVLSIVAVIFVGARFGQHGAGQQAMEAGDDAAAAAGRVATGPARAGDDFFSRIGALWNNTARIEQLERENRDLQAWRELAERLAERNARYEELLRMPPESFGQGADISRSIAAQLVLDSGGPFMRTLVANAGSDHGVGIGYIAVNENGLVGRVVSVGRRSSRVLMLDDYNSRIPVMGEASRVRAVLAGQATRPPDLYTSPFQMQSPRLDFIVGAQSLREGERMLTSGDGGLYPRGIPVGVARRGGDGQWRVALSASARAIDFVRLIPFVGAPAPEDEPADGELPPMNTDSAVAAVSREATPPPPTRPSATPAPPTTQRPAQQPRPQPAAAAPPSAPASPPPAATAEPAPAEQPSALGPPPAGAQE